jgi:hypothetical protein
MSIVCVNDKGNCNGCSYLFIASVRVLKVSVLFHLLVIQLSVPKNFISSFSTKNNDLV